MRRVVILGGGIGGAHVASLLAKKLPPRDFAIDLVSQTIRHTYQPGWLYVPFGKQDPRKLVRPLRDVLNSRVRLIPGEVVTLGTQARLVTVEQREGRFNLSYDTLVIATGARPWLRGIPGLHAAATHFFSEQAAFHLHSRLQEFRGGQIVLSIAGLPQKNPTALLEFALLLDNHLRQRRLREQTRLVFTSPLPRLCSESSVDQLVRPIFRKRGIQFVTGFNVERADPLNRMVLSLEGLAVPYELLIVAPPHRGAEFLCGHSIADPNGWVKTDYFTLEVDQAPGVYAIGDTCRLGVAKLGSAAHYQGEIVADRILAGTAPPSDASHPCYDGRAVEFLETGDGRAVLITSDYLTPPAPGRPSRIFHLGKLLLNKVYWRLVPGGLL